MSDLISLINCCYMQEKYIDDALLSCRRQVCDVPTETFIYHDNCQWGRGTGPATARNEAKQHAKGNWIIYNDGDNKLPNNFVQALWRGKKMAEEQFGIDKIIVGCPVQFISGRDLAKISARIPGIYSLEDFGDSVDISISSLFPRIAFDEVGGFDESFSPAEDVEFWVRLLKNGYKYLQTWETCLLKTNDGFGLTVSTPQPVRNQKFQMINDKHNLQLKPWEVV